MDAVGGSPARAVSSPITIVGLGPAGLDRTDPAVLAIVDAATTVILRTCEHPAAADLAARREVVSCDDLYETADFFADVYEGICARVIAAAAEGPVVYAVPGSAVVGERAVAMVRSRAGEAGIDIVIQPGQSFVDLAMVRVGIDPLDRGLQVIDGRDLPDPLLLGMPTLIAQVDVEAVLLEVRDALERLLPGDTPMMVLRDLGSDSEDVRTVALSDLAPDDAGLRVSLFVDPPPVGWPGLIRTNARLRRECPWDIRQTHHSLAKHLLEEAHEALEAIESLPADAPGGDPDVAGYLELEEELGDLLLQVVFHATLATEAGVFGVEEVAEGIRRKLVARHPHVFGDVEAETAEQVITNWAALKQQEKQRDSLLDGIPAAFPALARSLELQARAASVGFDWPDVDGVLAKVREEADELLESVGDPDAVRHEVGDLLFTLVNLARHLDVDPEQALRGASGRFERRFRSIEEGGDLSGLTLEEMDRRWEAAKAAEHA